MPLRFFLGAGRPVEEQLLENSVISADAEVVSCELGGGAALLDLRSSTYFSMNPVGAEVWQLIQTPRSVSEIQKSLLERYDVHPEKCLHDLTAILRHLLQQGLIRVSNEATS
jgi:hypothetical protein